MDVNDLYEELFLWEQHFQLSEDSSWTDGISYPVDSDGALLLLGNKPFGAADDFPAKIFGNASLGLSFNSANGSPNDDPLADWLDERIDIDEIDEFVNSPEFDAVMLDVTCGGDMTDMLDDITPFPLCPRTAATVPEDSSDGTDACKDCAESVYDDCGSLSSSSPEQQRNTVPNGYVPVDETTNVEFLQSPSNSSSHSTIVGDDEGSLSCNSFSTVGSLPCPSPLPGSPVDILAATSSNTNSSSASAARKRKSATTTARSRRARKPYARPAEVPDGSEDDNDASSDDSSSAPPSDRRSRKRDQNKTAATRYRIKKRSELDTLTQEEAQLEETNKALNSRATQLQTEISYLKSLMKEILVAKGLLKKSSLNV